MKKKKMHGWIEHRKEKGRGKRGGGEREGPWKD